MARAPHFPGGILVPLGIGAHQAQTKKGAGNRQLYSLFLRLFFALSARSLPVIRQRPLASRRFWQTQHLRQIIEHGRQWDITPYVRLPLSFLSRTIQ